MGDTKTLVVGQDVFTCDGHYNAWGKVVEVASTAVVVQLDHPACYSIRFDKNGTACDSSDLGYEGSFWGDSKIPGSEFGPNKLYLNPSDAGVVFEVGWSPSDPKFVDMMARLTKTHPLAAREVAKMIKSR